MVMEKSKLAILITSIIIVIAIIIIVIVVIVKRKNKSNDLPDEKPDENKESFFNAANGAFVDKGMNSLIGYNIQTDQLLNKPANELIGNIENDKFYAETGNLGAVYNTNNFNNLLKNQMEISSIASRDGDQVLSTDQQREISKRLNTSLNNGDFNLFNRAGTKNVKFTIQPRVTRAIIDGDYVPERDKNYNIEAVSKVVPIKGFDIDVERFPQQLAIARRKQIAENKANKKTNLDRQPSEIAAKSAEVLYNTAKKLDPNVTDNQAGIYTLTTGQ